MLDQAHDDLHNLTPYLTDVARDRGWLDWAAQGWREAGWAEATAALLAWVEGRQAYWAAQYTVKAHTFAACYAAIRLDHLANLPPLPPLPPPSASRARADALEAMLRKITGRLGDDDVSRAEWPDLIDEARALLGAENKN